MARAKRDAERMRVSDSTLDMAALEEARALLVLSPRRESIWPALIAATALALTSVAFATAMVLAPPVKTAHLAIGAPE